MKSRFLAAACLTLLFVPLLSFGNDLSREKAASLIKDAYHLPETESTTIAKKYVVKTWLVEPHTPGICTKFPAFSKEGAMLKAMQEKQLITILEKTTTQHKCNHIWANILLTDRGRKYLIKETDQEYSIRTADVTIDKVTGIRTNKDNNAALAEYTLKRINITPFSLSNVAVPVGRQSDFILYDDGWRIKK